MAIPYASTTLLTNMVLNVQELDREELKRFLTDSTEDREWVKPKAAPVNPKGDGGYVRNALYDKARDRLKDIFDNGPFYIGGCSELGYKTFDIKQYGYDTCEVNTKFRGFKSDLLIYRACKDPKNTSQYVSEDDRDLNHSRSPKDFES